MRTTSNTTADLGRIRPWAMLKLRMADTLNHLSDAAAVHALRVEPETAEDMLDWAARIDATNPSFADDLRSVAAQAMDEQAAQAAVARAEQSAPQTAAEVLAWADRIEATQSGFAADLRSAALQALGLSTEFDRTPSALPSPRRAPSAARLLDARATVARLSPTVH